MCYISLNKYLAKSPDLHTFVDLTRIRQIRHIRRNRHVRQIRQHGWPPNMELIYLHLAI